MVVTKKEFDPSGPDAESDLGPDKTEEFKLGITTIILGIVLLGLSVIFFIRLNAVTGATFGLTQVLFSIILAIVAMLFFRWIKFFMTKNRYLGLILGIGAVGASAYALFIRFRGPNTNVFAILGSIIILIYLGIHFYRTNK